jgi:hypothetical protein
VLSTPPDDARVLRYHADLAGVRAFAAARAERHLAVAADAELRRRHPGQRFTPLRSAEPLPPPRPSATSSP